MSSVLASNAPYLPRLMMLAPSTNLKTFIFFEGSWSRTESPCWTWVLWRLTEDALFAVEVVLGGGRVDVDATGAAAAATIVVSEMSMTAAGVRKEDIASLHAEVANIKL